MVLSIIGALLAPDSGFPVQKQHAACHACATVVTHKPGSAALLKTSAMPPASQAGEESSAEKPKVWDPGSPFGKFVPAPGATIDNVINDMSAPSETLPVKAEFNWQRHPVITQHAPRGDAIASWWTGNRPQWCHSALSWFTVYEAENNRASNSRVQIRNLRMYFLSEKTRKWRRADLIKSPRVGLWTYPFESVSGKSGERMEIDGGKSIKPNYPLFHHGYGNTHVIPDPGDIRAVYVAMDFRLILEKKDKEDDRNWASYVVNVGGDYYPGNDSTMSWSLGYAPGIGNGRYLRASWRWRTATLLVPNKDYGSTLEEMRENPPPLNCPC